MWVFLSGQAWIRLLMTDELSVLYSWEAALESLWKLNDELLKCWPQSLRYKLRKSRHLPMLWALVLKTLAVGMWHPRCLLPVGVLEMFFWMNRIKMLPFLPFVPYFCSCVSFHCIFLWGKFKQLRGEERQNRLLDLWTGTVRIMLSIVCLVLSGWPINYHYTTL